MAEAKLFFGVPVAFDHADPPLVETCHWTLSTVPVALALNVAGLPVWTDWLAGWVTTAGGETTTNVAALVVAVPAELVKTARNWWPLSAAVVEAMAYVVPVAPATVVQVEPLVDSCHWTVGAGVPVAAAVNEAAWPASTVWGVGWVVTTGATLTV